VTREQRRQRRELALDFGGERGFSRARNLRDRRAQLADPLLALAISSAMSAIARRRRCRRARAVAATPCRRRGRFERGPGRGQIPGRRALLEPRRTAHPVARRLPRESGGKRVDGDHGEAGG
jgi:hypothetical protein